MKKNGFTLIELIVTIALISVSATVILVNMVGAYDNQNEEQAKRFQSAVEEAACTFIDMQMNTQIRQQCKNNSQCNILLRDIVSMGLIDEELVDKETNCSVSSYLQRDNNMNINIRFEGNPKEKKCSWNRPKVVCE